MQEKSCKPCWCVKSLNCSSIRIPLQAFCSSAVQIDCMKRHKGNLRTQLYAGLQDTIDRGDARAAQV